jgi:low temperature requirement protein LtrA
MATADEEPLERVAVSTLELFFDLVFVFTITQLTSVLVHEPTWTGLLQVALMLGVIYWMYGGYAWLTNSVTLDRVTRRLTLLGGMGGFLIVALAVPGAFSGSGASFGLAYLAVVLVHLGMFARASRLSVVQAFRGLVPFNVTTALMVVIGGVAGGTAQYVLWIAAFALEWISPKLIDDEGFVIEPGHFVERHGLVVIVAIGESVVAVGIGAAGLPVDADLVLTALLGLALSACLWWSYFGVDEDAAEHALAAAPIAARPQMAIDAFGYWHLLILLGVIGVATGLKTATGHAFDPLSGALALALGGGTAVFLLGEALFRRTLAIPAGGRRAVAALLAAATIPLGTGIAAMAQLAGLVVLFVAMLSLRAPARSTA